MVEKLLKSLVEINTTNSLHNEFKITQFLSKKLKKYASKIEFIGDKKQNILIFFGNLQSKKILMFNGHLDVVFADKKEWATPPFKYVTNTDYAYGRGVADMKGGIAIALTSIIKAVEDNLLNDRLIIFAGTADEESGANSEFGAQLVAKYLKDKNIVPYGCIIPEPQPINEIMRINIGHRGLLWIKVYSKGTSLHSGLINVEDNAINKIISFISDLRSYITNQPQKNNGIPESSARVTNIYGGQDVFNKVPNYCCCNIDIRVSPNDNLEKIINILTKLSKKYDVEFDIIKQTPSSQIDKDSKIVKDIVGELTKLNKEYKISFSSPTCDAHHFVNIGIPTINGLGASGDKVHANNEFINRQSLSERIELFYNLIKNF
ncbi:MAG: M20 family metallopeptidase [Clostridia bacterium]|nr:M20 family metallopeptidase [Clostridia bacterium]